MGATASLPAHEATDAPRRPPTYTLDGDVLRLETSSPSNDGSAAIETAAAAPASYELVWIPRRDLPVLRRREVVREAPGDVDYTRHRGNDAARAAATDPTTVRLPAVLVRGGGRRKGGIVLLLAHGDGEDLGDVAGQAARLAAALRVDVLAYELSGWGRAPVVGLAPAQGGEGAARARGADRDGIDGSTDEEDNGDDAETPLHPTRSRRLPSEATLAADARAAYVYATTRLGGRGSSAVRRVVAVGRGTGALAAVGLAATPGVRLAGLVLASPPPTAVAAATNAAAPPLWGGAGAPPGRRVAAPTAPPVCPVLVVHDEGDDAVPLDATALRLAVGLRGRACRPPALSTSGRGGAAAAAAAAAAAEAASAASAAATVSGAGGLAAPPVVAHLRRFLRSLRYRRMSAQPGTSFCTSTVAESAAAGVPSRTVVSVPSMISAAAAVCSPHGFSAAEFGDGTSWDSRRISMMSGGERRSSAAWDGRNSSAVDGGEPRSSTVFSVASSADRWLAHGGAVGGGGYWEGATDGAHGGAEGISGGWGDHVTDEASSSDVDSGEGGFEDDDDLLLGGGGTIGGGEQGDVYESGVAGHSPVLPRLPRAQRQPPLLSVSGMYGSCSESLNDWSMGGGDGIVALVFATIVDAASHYALVVGGPGDRVRRKEGSNAASFSPAQSSPHSTRADMTGMTSAAAAAGDRSGYSRASRDRQSGSRGRASPAAGTRWTRPLETPPPESPSSVTVAVAARPADLLPGGGYQAPPSTPATAAAAKITAAAAAAAAAASAALGPMDSFNDIGATSVSTLPSVEDAPQLLSPQVPPPPLLPTSLPVPAAVAAPSSRASHEPPVPPQTRGTANCRASPFITMAIPPGVTPAHVNPVTGARVAGAVVVAVSSTVPTSIDDSGAASSSVLPPPAAAAKTMTSTTSTEATTSSNSGSNHQLSNSNVYDFMLLDEGCWPTSTKAGSASTSAADSSSGRRRRRRRRRGATVTSPSVSASTTATGTDDVDPLVEAADVGASPLSRDLPSAAPPDSTPEAAALRTQVLPPPNSLFASFTGKGGSAATAAGPPRSLRPAVLIGSGDDDDDIARRHGSLPVPVAPLTTVGGATGATPGRTSPPTPPPRSPGGQAMPSSPLTLVAGNRDGDMAEEQLTSASVAAVQDSLRAAYAARDDFFSPDHIDVSSSADDDDECASAAERTWRAPTAEALAASAAAAAAAAEPPKPGMPRVAASNSTAVGDATAVTTAATHEAVDVLWKQGDKSVDAKGCSRVKRALSASPSFPRSPPIESTKQDAPWPPRQDGLYADEGGCVAVATLNRSRRGGDAKAHGRPPLVRSHSSVASLSAGHPPSTATLPAEEHPTPESGSAAHHARPPSRPPASRSVATAAPTSRDGSPLLKRRGLRFRRPATDARTSAAVAPSSSPAADENLLPMPPHSAAHAMVAAAAAAASPAAIAAAARVRATAGSFSASPGGGGGVESGGGRGGATNSGTDAAAVPGRVPPVATTEGRGATASADKGTAGVGGSSAYRRLANALGKRRAVTGAAAPGAEGAVPPMRASVDWRQPGTQRHSAEVWRPDPADALGGDSASGGRPAPMPLRQAPWFGAPPNNPAEDDGSRPHRLHRLGGAVPGTGLSATGGGVGGGGGGGRGAAGLLSRLRGVRRTGGGGRGGATFPRAGGVVPQPADVECGGGLFRRQR